MSTGELSLRDFKPRTALVTEDHTPQRARFPVVEIHNHLRHISADASALVGLMDELNIRCTIDLDGGWGDQLDQHLARFKHPYPDRFCVFARVDWSQFEEPGFGRKWAARLADAVHAGAQGLKVSKRLGLSGPKVTREQAHVVLEDALPAETYYAFHLNLIRHGRQVCNARKPLCEACALREVCDVLYGDFHGGWITCADQPCPLCEFEDQAHCQLDTGRGLFPSDRNLGTRHADDFRPGSTFMRRMFSNRATRDTPASQRMQRAGSPAWTSAENPCSASRGLSLK